MLTYKMQPAEDMEEEWSEHLQEGRGGWLRKTDEHDGEEEAGK